MITSGDFIESMLEHRTTGIARDLKLNLKRLLEESTLSSEEATLTLLAISTSVDHQALIGHAKEKLQSLSVPQDQIQEAAEVAAIMGMLNIYYRFRHMVGKEDDYKTANLRMTSMARPALGKEKYEMLALAVSVINGCENCIKAHEKVLRDSGFSADKVHDLARMAAVVNGLKALERSV